MLADLLVGAAGEFSTEESFETSERVTCSVAGFLIGSETGGSELFILVLGEARLTGSGFTWGWDWLWGARSGFAAVLVANGLGSYVFSDFGCCCAFCCSFC